MKGVLLDVEPRVEELPDPPLLPGHVRVRVRRAGITGLDRDVLAGRVPFRGVPGVCFVGEVVEVDGVEGRSFMGRRVIGRGSYGCGRCDMCRAGTGVRCVDRVRPGYLGVAGGHAEQVVLPARAIMAVPDAIDDDAALLLPLLAGIWSGVSRVELPEWTNILVVGDGGMGLLSALALASAGYTVTVRGKHGNRFDLLRRHNVHFNLVTDDAEVRGQRPGRFGPALVDYPFVVEASGSPTGWEAAQSLVSAGGTIFLVSSCADGIPRALDRAQEKNVRVLGLREGDLEMAASILAAGLFDPGEVISSAWPFADALQAYRRADTPAEWFCVLDFLDTEAPGRR